MSVVGEFWALVRIGDVRECWEWRGPINHGNGYGVVTSKLQLAFRDTFAHRIACLITRDNAAGHPMVLHSCDNPPCCNPRHLRWGTAAENREDRDIADWARGARLGIIPDECRPGLIEERTPEVSRQRVIRLTPELVSEIRRDFDAGMPVRDIAAKYVITKSHADNVAKRRIWKSVPEPANDPEQAERVIAAARKRRRAA